MRDISAKADNVGDTLPAGDFNANHRSELQNIATGGGFTLDAEGGPDTDLNMLGKTIAMYANAGWYYAESGAANAYVLTRVGTLQSVRAYVDGMIVIFLAGNANTGASTINVDTLGSKDLELVGGVALSGGEIGASYVIARYHSSGDRFEIVYSQALINQAVFATSLPGSLTRGQFTYVDTADITARPSMYHHQGTTEQLVFWDSTLTINLSGAGASTVYYLYLDDSAIVTAGTNLLTASEFIWSTTAPTWSDSRHGYYNGLDRCIFAILTDGSSNILRFYHDGGRYIEFDAQIVDLNGVDIDTAFTDVILTIPDFGDNAQAQVTFQGLRSGGDAGFIYYRKNGSSASVNKVAQITSANNVQTNSRTVTVDASQIIEVAMEVSNASTMSVFTDGFYLPAGM